MKLSIWSSYYVDLSPEDAILELAKNGIHYCELSDEHAAILMKRGNPKETGKAFGKFARSNGVEVSQGHLWLSVALCSDTDNTVEILKNWLDLFDAIGIKAAVLHCDRITSIPDIDPEERIQRNVAVLKQLAAHIDGRDIRICLENLRNAQTLCATAELLLKIIGMVGSDRLAICLDTGHLNLCENKNQEHFIRTAGKYLKALHIADNDCSGDQHIMPFGKGNIKFDVVVKTLKETGYDGLFNYEIPGERQCPLKVRAMKLEYIKNTFNYLESL